MEKLLKIWDEYVTRFMADWHYRKDGIGDPGIPGIRLIYLIRCTEKGQMHDGRGSGVFIYGGRAYRFHITLKDGGWQMESLDGLIFKDDGYGGYVKPEETCFGRKAFWDNTPADCLDEEEKTLRKLMRYVAGYCSRHPEAGK